jgi:NADH-quinone oxidoreductase subunit J
MNWIQDNWALLLPLVLGACGVWLMMPGAKSIRPLGGLACLGALVLGFQLVAGSRDVSGLMFLLFATGALVSAVLMITSRNPVYAALWFAVVTLSVCGLFLLQSAPFLAAASIIVYAGAIIVTFLFVIMLAQQAGSSSYDQSSRQPFCASVAAFTLLGLLLITFQSAAAQRVSDGARDRQVNEANKALAIKVNTEGDHIHKSSLPLPSEELGQLRGLGRALFTDYLFAVEIGGTLLLISSIGAIALAPRRAQGTL